ncbi:unnamed protein product [Periconia digitata]|uniref:F-box domain-containing protein n=1 Tax=Periconia digitata TaxID=1303443 RepID=A0A9W4UKF7_9PLEO|nr:unnamed protein product [Periconia digitata]
MENLPDEVLLLIFENLTQCKPRYWRTRTQRLRPLTLVSRRLHRIATPMLYEHIQGSKFLASESWVGLAKTLHQNTNLAQHVKSINAQFASFPYREYPPHDLLLNLMKLWDMVQKLHIADIYELEKRSRSYCDNILLTFWVLLCERLETLVMNLSNDSWIGEVGGTRTGTLPLAVEELGRAIYADLDSGGRRYDCLRTLNISLTEWSCFHLTIAVPFLSLPNLKTLALAGEGSYARLRTPFYGREPEYPVRTSSVEHVHLKFAADAKTKPSDLVNLLLACKALKRFDCLIFWSPIPEEWFEAVSKSLQIHSNTLQFLTLSYSSPDDENLISNSSCLPEYLRNMDKLTHVDVPYATLFRNHDVSNIAQLLPPSLEFLTLRLEPQVDMADWAAMDAIIEHTSSAIYIAYQEGVFPNLEAVEIMLYHGSWYHPQPRQFAIPKFNIEHTRSALRSHGVHFDVSLYYDWHEGYADDPTPEFPATIPTMRAFKWRFPGFVRWSPHHHQLRASTCEEPQIERDIWDWGVYRWSPHVPPYQPWDWENEESPELPDTA